MADFDRVRSSAASHATCPICLDDLVSLPQEVGALTFGGRRVEPALYHCTCVGVDSGARGRPRLPGGCSPVTRRPIDGFEFMPPLQDRQRWMNFVDWNGDGSVTVSELSVAVAALLPVDENGTEQFVRDSFAVGDDVITKGELEASVLPYLEAHLAELTNTAPSVSAPMLTRSSTRAELLQWFKHWDADGSSCLDAEELHYALAALFFRSLGSADSETKQAVTEAFFLELNLDRDAQISKTKFLEDLAPVLQANLPLEGVDTSPQESQETGNPIRIRLLSATTGVSTEALLPTEATLQDLRREAQHKLLERAAHTVPDFFLAGRRLEGSDDTLLSSFRGFHEGVVVQVLARTTDEEADRLRRMREEIAREREAVRRQREEMNQNVSREETEQARTREGFSVGTRVQLHGLGRPELNGRSGTVLRFDEANTRYIVDLDGPDGGQKSIKPENLVQASNATNQYVDSFKRMLRNGCARAQIFAAQYEWWQLMLGACLVLVFAAAFFDVSGRYASGGRTVRGGDERGTGVRHDERWDDPVRGERRGDQYSAEDRYRSEGWQQSDQRDGNFGDAADYGDYDRHQSDRQHHRSGRQHHRHHRRNAERYNEDYYDEHPEYDHYEGGGSGGFLGGYELQTLLLLGGLGYACWTGIIPIQRMSFFELMMLWQYIVEPLLMGRRGRGRGGYGGSVGGFGRMGGFGMGGFGGLGGFGRGRFF